MRFARLPLTARTALVTAVVPVLGLGAAGLLAGCAADEPTATDAAESTAEPTPTADGSASAPSRESSKPAAQGSTEPEPEPEAGRLVAWEDWEQDRAAYAGSDVVLYFHADWCHECQDTDASLAADGVPAGLTLVQIDYDERTDLRQQYGVTVQHSFVLVDDAGERQDIWTDTSTGAEIAARAA